jgi:hypothetical protein
VPETTWHQHYRSPLEGETAFDDRLFDPEGLRPPIWFQEVPESKASKNRLHIDLYPTARDSTPPMERLIEIIEAKVAELIQPGPGWSAETRMTTQTTRCTTWSCATRKAMSSASADRCPQLPPDLLSVTGDQTVRVPALPAHHLKPRLAPPPQVDVDYVFRERSSQRGSLNQR